MTDTSALGAPTPERDRTKASALKPRSIATSAPQTAPPAPEEDDDVRLFDWIARNSRPLTVVQPDPHGDPRAVVLVVDGGVVATMRLETLVHPDSPLARGIMAKASANYRRAGRPEPFAAKPAGGVGGKPADGDVSSVANAEPVIFATTTSEPIDGIAATQDAPDVELDVPAFTRAAKGYATAHKVPTGGNASEMGWGEA